MTETTTRYPMLEDDGIRRFMAETDALYPPARAAATVAEQRRLYDRLCAHFRKGRPATATVTVSDHRIDGPGGILDVRLYRPAAGARRPALLYLHGGGFVVGGLDSHDDVCAELAERADVAVLAVDYRLAPEHVFPAALDDAMAALAWLRAEAGPLGIEAGRIAVGGDSAGGTLAAAACLRCRDAGLPAPTGQVLIYPWLGGDPTAGSYVSQAEAPGLTAAGMAHYRALYLGPEAAEGPASKYAEPLAETDYRGLPPAFLVACRFDPLHDDCAAYAARLAEAGVAATVRDEPLLVHGCLRARHMSAPAGRSFAAIARAAASLAHDGRLPAGSTED